MRLLIPVILAGSTTLSKAVIAASLIFVPGQSQPLRIVPDPIAERQPAVNSLMLSGTAPQDFWAETKIYRAPGGVPVIGLVGRDESMAADRPSWSPLQAMMEEAAIQLNKRGFSALIAGKRLVSGSVLQVNLERLEIFYGKAVIKVAVEHLDSSGRRLAGVARSRRVAVPENWRLFTRESSELKRLIRSAGADLILEALSEMNRSS